MPDWVFCGHCRRTLLPANGSIEVRSEVEGGVLFVDGKRWGPIGTTPQRVVLVSGGHRLRLEVAGYVVEETPVVVKPGGLTQVRLAPRRLTGSIVVTVPQEGAVVSIDDQHDAVSGQAVSGLLPGPHRLTVKAPGYKPHAEEIDVRPQVEVRLVVQLVRLTGGIRIKASGQDDRILLDGRPVGATPRELTDLVPGNYRIAVEAEGYRGFEGAVEVVGGQVRELAPVLVRQTGSITVAGSGIPDQVRIDGKSYGPSPYRATNLPVGTYAVRVEAPGHEPHEEKVILSDREEAQVKPTLTARPGTLLLHVVGDETTYREKDRRGPFRLDLRVRSDGKRIALDEQGVRDLTFAIELPVGPQTVEFKAGSDKFKTAKRPWYALQIDLKPGEIAAYRMTIRLERDSGDDVTRIKRVEKVDPGSVPARTRSRPAIQSEPDE